MVGVKRILRSICSLILVFISAQIVFGANVREYVVATAQEGVDTLRFEEVWRIGDKATDPLFGMVTDAVVDAGGNVYLLDVLLQQIVKITPEGKYEKVVCRQGSGPGEVENVQNLLMDENSLVMMKVFPAELEYVDLEGIPIKTISLQMDSERDSSFFTLGSVSINGGLLLYQGVEMSVEGSKISKEAFLTISDASGSDAVCIDRKSIPHFTGQEITINEDKMFVPFSRNRFCLLDDGRAVFAPLRDKYLLEVRDRSGAKLATIVKDESGHVRTKEEMNDVKYSYLVTSPGVTFDIKYVLLKLDPAIVTIESWGNEVWIMSSQQYRTLPVGVCGVYDVVDARDGSCRQVSIELPVDKTEDMLIRVAEESILCIENVAANYNVQALGGDEGESGRREEPDEGEELVIVMYKASAMDN